ncbi:alanine racemase [uncultured Eubacterium sp.]|uniref:alanine racemase n=1 Tax=uncultured Eubacterium sp. TaxID=165185 RepID=UPI0015B224CE|nr:alanine racemase [uncultured Eubacterium sp.]
MNHRTYLEIDLNKLEHNFNCVRNKLPDDVKILGVIKANAYGHGAVEIGEFLDDKCDFFGVACIEEAVELKKAGIKTPILILGRVFPFDIETAVKYDVRIPIFSYEDAVALSNEAVKQGKNVPFHFCIDTGMSRIGFQVNEESADICKSITELPNIFAEGLFSHFATADEKDLSKTVEQRNQYKKFCKMLSDRKIEIPIKHLNNSAGIMNFDEHFDMCRMGIITYGLYPSDEVDKGILDLEPIMSWHTKIAYIKDLEPNREISYGGTFKTDRVTKVATVPVGYADGFPRCLSNKGKVIINGKYAKILGRVCMDQFMVDVSDIECNVNDEVVLFGTQKNAHISLEELSNSAYSFNYELPCRIPLRVNRVYVYNGQTVKDVGLV